MISFQHSASQINIEHSNRRIPYEIQTVLIKKRIFMYLISNYRKNLSIKKDEYSSSNLLKNFRVRRQETKLPEFIEK